MIRTLLIALGIAGCCKPVPPPIAPAPVIVTERRCLDGVKPPELAEIPSVACAGAAFWCLDRVGYSLLVNQLTALYRYRDRAEQRCRAPKPATPEMEKSK